MHRTTWDFSIDATWKFQLLALWLISDTTGTLGKTFLYPEPWIPTTSSGFDVFRFMFSILFSFSRVLFLFLVSGLVRLRLLLVFVCFCLSISLEVLMPLRALFMSFSFVYSHRE